MKTKKATKKKVWTEFSRYIRYRDGIKRPDGWYSECITCKTVKPIAQMQAGHFVSRSCSKLLFDERNVHAQCQACNLWHSGEQYLYGKEIDLRYGNGVAEELHNQRHQTKKFTIGELEELLSYYKERIKEYEAD